MKKYNWIEIGVMLLSAFLLVFIYISRQNSRVKQIETQKEQYILMDSSHDVYKGVIASIHPSSILPKTKLLELTDGTMLRTETTFSYDENRNEQTYKYLNIGDTIYKPANSDTLYISDTNSQRYLILGSYVK